MSDTRIESAVNRIETALARIAEVADNPPATAPSVSALVIKHEALREVANSTLAELDTLIDEMDQ
ncbi:hypothetical protein HKD42_03915 [Altererythrobacter sp. RZ02]|uniref:Uncharacterized protein n=1 Tax=Pontixanthobacter rizhaonensis TaxID=2730337 RepID=A0A848QKB6_9SPHN|nr:hypothetical protein [Pontixanthobacter rizhaonensis]NMW31200.1 hypothetical protein [Pontixanthobacter rizhaonensis]